MTNSTLISHEKESASIDSAKASIKEQLKTEALPEGTTLKEAESIVDELSKFGFGKFLLKNRGINGKWTRYMVLYPRLWKNSPVDLEGNPQTEFERWMLTSAPIIMATQERFTFFQEIMQSELKDESTLISVACGMMDDLLCLDFSKTRNPQLIGTDLDSQSLALAKEQATSMGMEQHTNFILADAWDIPLEQKADILTSNGLNIYEPDDEKVLALFASFFKALKPGGLLVTSFFTKPPALSSESPWSFTQINTEDLALQKLMFVHILAVRFQCYSTESLIKKQLESAGFKEISFRYDRAKLFPTVTARRPL